MSYTVSCSPPCSAFLCRMFAVFIWIHMYFTIFCYSSKMSFMKDVTLEGARVPEAYTSYERSEVRKVFKAFDEDGSGSLDTEEIEQVMCSFGITPFKSTVEALPEVYATFPQETAPRNCFILTNCTGVVVVYGRRMRKEQISTTKSQEQKINFSDVIQESAIAVVDEDSTGVSRVSWVRAFAHHYMKTEGFTRHLAHKRAGISNDFRKVAFLCMRTQL